MMDFDLYLLFIIAAVTLALIPGPNVAFIVGNSIAHDVRHGLVSVAGTTSAMIPQLIITVLGASAIVTFMASAFVWLKWAGVLYLLYLGIKNLFFCHESKLDIGADKKLNSYKKIYWRGFFVSATNPKTLLFFGAFLPQFVSPDGGAVMIQMSILAVTFVVIGTLIDAVWAIVAGHASRYLERLARLRHRISGAFFILAATGLALAHKS